MEEGFSIFYKPLALPLGIHRPAAVYSESKVLLKHRHTDYVYSWLLIFLEN